MKYLTFASVAFSFMLPMFAQAATVSVSTTQLTVAAGQTVSVAVMVDAGQDRTVTVKSDVRFSSNLLQVVGFTPAPTWIALNQPGYDSATAGQLIKTAGYPGGFTGTKQFGVITFRALRTGVANVSVGDSTQTLNVQNGGTTVVNRTNAQITVVPAPTPAVVTPVQQVGAAALTGVALGTQGPDQSATTSSLENLAQTAAAANAVEGGISAWVWIVVGLLVLAGLGYWVYRLTRKQGTGTV